MNPHPPKNTIMAVMNAARRRSMATLARNTEMANAATADIPTLCTTEAKTGDRVAKAKQINNAPGTRVATAWAHCIATLRPHFWLRKSAIRPWMGVATIEARVGTEASHLLEVRGIW